MKTMDFEKIEDRIGRGVAARLVQGCDDDLPHDITERLKAARMRALAKHREVAVLASSTGIAASHAGSASLYIGDSGDENSIWTQFGAWFPLVVLLVGLIGIPAIQNDHHASEVANVDIELLGDELPPAAYTDPGFVHFLNARRHAVE